ncbi:EAL domain-containing protein [uncultured Dialister sp.]|mgnify:FL=1|jgi:EAL domain-containing protein (putative c-di-GMP-specific phosphodiesterase class I)/GGDEF domain-containing protein|uniref:EAL domain-containing protein n=1 Tax=uncultured Dialister sp. TaxID=278064 RepID=UPI0025CD93D5|nr:EAL domain-containing protein [uncultured Dialister sp.]
MTQKSLTYTSILEHAMDGMPGGVLVYRADETEEILYANSWLIHTLGCLDMDDFMAVTGGTFKSFVHPCDAEKVEKNIERQISSGADVFDYVNYRIVTKDGTVKTVEEFGHRLQVPGIGPVFYVFFLDSSARYVLHDIDGITGLPGQTRFLKEASLLLSLSGETERKVMLYMNIRNFRMYNLLYSSQRGNEFLQETARILKTAFPDALISRFSDDHFAILTGRTGVEEKIDRAYEKIMALRKDVDLAVKFGLYVIVDGSMKPEIACDLAKTAADSIKDNYQLHLQVYTDKIGKKAFIKSYVMDHLQEAMDKKYIQIYLQPVIRTISGTLCSAEALSRWIDPVYGFLSPADFIPALEESRQIQKLDLYVLEEICRTYRSRVDKGLPVIPISFNLSRIDFYSGSIFEEVDAIVRKYQVPHCMIHVEITESVFVKDGVSISTQIDKFRDAGFEMWMDDFGSGYSSLNVLKDYHFDEIKIDMAFLSSFTQKAKDIIKSTVRMAKDIGIHTLVEGVETEEQRDFVRSIGCEKIQGWYYGRPMPLSELESCIREKGWILEDRALKNYYNPLGSVDFLTDESMALVEMNEGKLSYLFVNHKFRQALASGGSSTPLHSARELNSSSSSLGRNIRAFFMNILRTGQDQTLTYPKNNRYMHLTGHHISTLAGKNRHLFQVHLSNITISPETGEADTMDDILRNLYYLYQSITVVNLKDDTATPIIANTPFRQYLSEKTKGLESLRKAAESQIHPDDRPRYRRFTERQHLYQLLKEDPGGTAVSLFRTLGEDEKYHWSVHTIMAVPNTGFMTFLYAIKRSFMNYKDFREPMLEICREWME